MVDLSWVNAALVPVVIALVEVVRKIGLPVKYAPAMALVFGVACVGLLDGFTTMSLMVGVGTGLMASGLYSGTKATVA